MPAILKRILIVAAIAAAIFAGGYALGRFSTPAKVLTIEKPGTIEYRDRIVWQPTTNTGPCCVDYNIVLSYLNEYLSSPPIVDTVTRDTIRFHIMSNRYALAYALHDVPVWHIAPVAGGTLFYADGRFYPLANAGVAVDYGNVGGQIIGGYGGSAWSVSALGHLRF